MVVNIREELRKKLEAAEDFWGIDDIRQQAITNFEYDIAKEAQTKLMKIKGG